MRNAFICFAAIVIAFIYLQESRAENVIYGNSSTGPQPFGANTSGQMSITLLSGEDQTNGVFKTEQQFSYCANKTADAQCGASGTRFVHTLTCASNDAAATAGSVALSDATAAGSGNVLVIGFPAAYVPAATVFIDATFTTGIYLDFTTTADVSCTVSYR